LTTPRCARGERGSCTEARVTHRGEDKDIKESGICRDVCDGSIQRDVREESPREPQASTPEVSDGSTNDVEHDALDVGL
jgi:hypothetical protein